MSTDYSSYTNSLIEEQPSRQSIKHEVKDVAKVLKKERDASSLTLGVVRDASLTKLEDACDFGESTFKKRPKVLFSSAETLQEAIDAIKLSAKRVVLNILVSPEIQEIFFHVPSHFKVLKVLRCNLQNDGGTLDIHGSSTYNSVPLDKWEAHRHKHHKFMINMEKGTRIKIPGLINLPSWSRCRSHFSDEDSHSLRGHLETLEGESRWDAAKGTVAAIMGIVAGTVKFSVGMSGAVGGVYAKYAFGLHAIEIGAAGAKFSAVATAAGPAVVLGVAAAAAVYFIPWEALFEWLKPALWSVWEKIGELWDRFKSWVIKLFSKPSKMSGHGQWVPRRI